MNDENNDWSRNALIATSAIMDTGLSATAKTIAIKLLLLAPSGRGRFRAGELRLWTSLKDRRAAMVALAELVDAGVITILSRPNGSTFYYSYSVSLDAVRAWCHANRVAPPPDARSLLRKQRKAAAVGSHTPGDIWRIYMRQTGMCAMCRKHALLTIDHIVAVSKGGSDDPSNIQLLCRPCNSRKGNKSPVELSAAWVAL